MILVRNLTVRAGTFALRGINLKVEKGQYAVLMGRTGCGKTTLLEAICGLRPTVIGGVALGGRDVTRLKPAERGVGYVPQDRCLFQTMTVRDNLAFALTIRRWSRARIHSRVEELAQLLSITHLLDRHPHGLSGGEAQRVALGRALAFDPAVLCLDEPLSALDAATREEMQSLLLTIRDRTGATILHVTHDMNEAVRLADRLFILQDGGIVLAEATEMKRSVVYCAPE